MSLKVIAAPTEEPVTLVQAKAHLRMDDINDDDTLIKSLIVVARENAEHLTGRALMPQTLELGLDSFGDEIRLPRPPFVSITSVTYVDLDGATQTLSSDCYVVDGHSEPARIARPYTERWPSTRGQPNAVLIRYQAGYTEATAVPEGIKAWMLIRIGTLYEHRQAVVSGLSISSIPDIDRLLDAYRTYI